MRKDLKSIFRIDPARVHFATTRWLQLQVDGQWVTVGRFWLNKAGKRTQDPGLVAALAELLGDEVSSFPEPDQGGAFKWEGGKAVLKPGR